MTNGSFELPMVAPGSFTLASTGSSTIPGWTVVGASGNVAVTSGTFAQNGYSFPAENGKQWLDLTGTSNTATGVSQTVTTVPGTSYSLSFWVGNVVDPGGIFGASSTVKVQVNGVNIFSATNSNGSGTMTMNWKRFGFSFFAFSTSTKITFINGDPASDTSNGLDGVLLSQ
ncbi:MAG TPA: DUF642 domain-containing protein [Candidatus Binataceae bacterium]